MKMTIAVQCGSCRKRFAVKEELAGRKFKCPQCGGVLMIPEPRPEPKTPRPITDLLDDYERASPPAGEKHSSTAGTAGGTESAPDTAPKCPSCGASFTAGALICFECGYDRRVGKKREVAGPGTDGRAFRWLRVCAIGGVCIIFLVIGFIGYTMVQPQAAVGVGSSGIVETPKEFVEVKFGEEEYLCACPKDWEVTSGGGKEGVPPWTTFEKGGASIQIRDSLSGTPGGALQRSLQMGTDIERGEAPVDKVHEHRKQSAADAMRNYEESAPQKLNHLLGDALISEFTATPMLSDAIRGYRATVFHNFHQFNILCRCTESEWEILNPAFKHVISSLAPVEKELGTP
jgi:DNA-directed RNA polymerase subunit RPC12/RpoP